MVRKFLEGHRQGSWYGAGSRSCVRGCRGCRDARAGDVDDLVVNLEGDRTRLEVEAEAVMLFKVGQGVVAQ